MKIEDFKEGQRVFDRWWPWKLGVVKKVLKTRVHIRFGEDELCYDKAHLQFLEIC